MALHRCIAFEGETTLIEREPAISEHASVIYDPAAWGLYDEGRKLLTASAYFRGPRPDLVNATYTTELRPSWVEPEAPDDLYFFVGPLHRHYGHFLLSSLARLWAWPLVRDRRPKLLSYGDPIGTVAETPFMSALLAAAGISIDDFVTFHEPIRLPRVIVAAPSFEESNFAHRAFAAVTRQLGERLLQGTEPNPIDRPAYLARWGLRQGVHRLINEEEFASVIAREGVDIVFPEQLTLQQQVRLLADRRKIVGQGGSAFHTAALAPESLHMLSLQYGPSFLSNQVLLDRICGHHAVYLYPPDGMQSEEPTPDFTLNFRLADPQAAAEDMLRIMSPFMGVSTRFAAPSRPNLAAGRPTRQSSVEGFSRGLSTTQDSAGAVSGFWTGSYQFHTACEAEPWWQVDLEHVVSIDEVQLFNRLDAGRERASAIGLSVSFDGTTWTTVLTHRAATAFGGLDGDPLTWRPDQPVAARFLRVTLLATSYLHLDQVVVYGHSLPADDRR